MARMVSILPHNTEQVCDTHKRYYTVVTGNLQIFCVALNRLCLTLVINGVKVWIHTLHLVLDFSRKLPDVAEQSAAEGASGEKSELEKGVAIC